MEKTKIMSNKDLIFNELNRHSKELEKLNERTILMDGNLKRIDDRLEKIEGLLYQILSK